MTQSSPSLLPDQQRDLDALTHEVKQSIAAVLQERETRENEDMASQLSQSIQSSSLTLL